MLTDNSSYEVHSHHGHSHDDSHQDQDKDESKNGHSLIDLIAKVFESHNQQFSDEEKHLEALIRSGFSPASSYNIDYFIAETFEWDHGPPEIHEKSLIPYRHVFFQHQSFSDRLLRAPPYLG